MIVVKASRGVEVDTACVSGAFLALLSLEAPFWGVMAVAAMITSIIGILNVTESKLGGLALAILGVVISGFQLLASVALLLGSGPHR